MNFLKLLIFTIKTCLQNEAWYTYPDDFNILNEVAMYTCPSIDSRVIISNGIPDHGMLRSIT